jgi:hypothetical protein
LKEEQERLREQHKFANILPLQFRSPQKSPPSPFSVYYSSSQKSSPIFKYEKAFEAIRKNERDCKETLRRYIFRKPRKHVGPNEQVSPISILDSKED